MNAYFSYLNDLLNEHKTFYRNYPGIRWLSPYEASEYQQKRDTLMLAFEGSALFKGTKPFLNHISPGCSLCGQGKWSCLFITGKCNAACFYCPALQKADHLPTTQGLTFKNPLAYAEYINYFGFQGVAFSGGEPLLVKDRTLAYLKVLRDSCSPELYIWMYTNGILADKTIFKDLGRAGLNEVRFDIGANGFKLDRVYNAIDAIKNITIEIPAVPEEAERLKKMLPEMIKAGVTNLNLHQMRLTPYNAAKLAKKGYRFIAAERPIVLESELAALEIMNYTREKGLPIGINYCSFFFKYRFQKSGFRNIIHTKLAPDTRQTECNYIRNINNGTVSYENYLFADEGKLPLSPHKLELKYKTYEFHKVTSYTTLAGESACAGAGNLSSPPEDKDCFEIWRHETIESKLREY